MRFNHENDAVRKLHIASEFWLSYSEAVKYFKWLRLQKLRLDGVCVSGFGCFPYYFFFSAAVQLQTDTNRFVGGDDAELSLFCTLEAELTCLFWIF